MLVLGVVGFVVVDLGFFVLLFVQCTLVFLVFGYTGLSGC